MGTTLNRFPNLVGELVNHAFLHESSLSILLVANIQYL